MIIKKIYRESGFTQRVFARTNDFDIQSIVGNTITTAAPHGLISGDRVVLWFQGPRGVVIKTIATVLGITSFTVPDTLPPSYTAAGGFHPQARTGTLTGEVFAYPDKRQVLPGILTISDNSSIAIVSESAPFNFVPGMTLDAGTAVVNREILDWVTTETACGGCADVTHKIVLNGPSVSAYESPEFSLNGIDYTDTLQTELQYTIPSFTGDPLYGEIIFTVPETAINGLTQTDHLLQINLNGVSTFREILTFTGEETTTADQIADGTYRTIFLGGTGSATTAPGGSSLIKTGSAFSIPASGAVTLSVDPADAFSDGQTESVSIFGVPGTLSRAGATYTFTRSVAGAITTVPGNSLITIVAGAAFISALAPQSQGLSVVNQGLGLLPTGPDIDLHSRDIYTERIRPSSALQAGGRLLGEEILDAFVSLNDRVIGAILGDGTWWFSDIQTKSLRPIPYPNQLGLVWGVESEDQKILMGVRADGHIYCQGVFGADIAGGSASATDAEGVIYRTESNQVLSESGLLKRVLTSEGTNRFSSLSPDGIKIYFTSDRDGATKNFWMDRDGSNQFYAGLDPYLFSNKIFHVIWTGQSLSEGATSTAQSLTQNYANLKFNGGVKPGNTPANLTSFVPLTENNFERGTVAFTNVLSKYAREVATGNTALGGEDNIFLCTAVGVGARMLRDIKKNPTGVSPEPSYAHSIAQVQAGVTLATAQGKTLEVPFIVFHHGESDDALAVQNQIPSYKDLLVIFWDEYNVDIKAATGQSRNVKILMSQLSAWTFYGRATPNSAIDQYEAWEENPDKYTLVTPKYWIPTSDGVHLTASGYQALNEMMAIAASVEAQQGKTFKPVYPTSITRNGAVITANFHTPVWPLVFDTTEVSNPGNFGFEYFDTTNTPITINSVTMGANKSSVVITLATATAGFLAYAYTGTANNDSGPFTGARGNLRDSALYPSNYSQILRNWCVHFYKGVA